jgi:hypothetical protein
MNQNTPTPDKNIAAKAKKAVGKLTEQRLAATGRTTRARAHVSSRGKRTQAKRDSR